jgi:prepilin-type N-terminal cleavage/methylation domain-containing protein
MKNVLDRGFTLLEVIVTMTVAAILATMLVSMTGTALTGSASLPFRQIAVYDASQIMDQVIADYISMLPRTDDVLSELKTNVDSGHYGTYTSSTTWILYNTATNPATKQTGSSTDGILQVTISPPSGGTGISLTELFTR